MPTDFPTPQQMHAFGHFISSFVSMAPKLGLMLVLAIIGVFVIRVLIILALRLLDIRRLLNRKTVLLEITPHAFADIDARATQALFSELHGLEVIRTRADKLLSRKPIFSPEMISTREGGIRYVIRVAKSDRKTFEREVAGYDSKIQFQQVEDYLPNPDMLRKAKVLEFRQTRHFAYPLKKQTQLDVSDLVTYMTNAMTKLRPGELMALQLVLSPTQIRHADDLAAKILYNEEQTHTIGKHRSAVGKTILLGINKLLFAIIDGVSDTVHGSSSYTAHSHQNDLQHDHQVAKRIKPARTLGHIEQPIAQAVYDKLSDNLYRANIRVLVLTNDKPSMTERANSMRKALSVFDVPKYQKLRARPDFPYVIKGLYRQFMFKNRLPGLRNKQSCILSASEIGGIYHFPHSVTARTEGVIRSLSSVLPAPPLIKKRADNHEFDVIFGKNIHHGDETNIGLLAKDREKHVYIIGGTGNGKTTLMEYGIVQDIRNGKGVAFIDPHGDSAKKVLKYIPKKRMQDVIYLNPIDIKHPVGLNLLELPEGLDEDELLIEKGRVTSAVVSVMRKVFSDDEANAHRIEAIMRNAVHTALTVEGATLFTVLKLLRNEKFRKDVVSKLEDEDLKDFWREEIGQAGEMQLVSMTRGVTQRIDRFKTSEPAKRMLGQAKSTISFEDIMDSGKILICDLGNLEEDESSLFGTTILAKLKMAAERRARMPEGERRPFYTYVDEFQNFATTPFVKMLSSSRKYKFFLTIAEQSTKQQDDDRQTEAILSNISTVVCFRTGSHDDEELMLHRFEPFIKEGEISNLPTYNFYIRIQAQESIEPMSGKTIVLPEKEASETVAEAVVETSRTTYAITYVKPVEPKPKKQGQGNKDNKRKGDNRKGKGKSKGSSDLLDANDDK
ncbi:MAG TPA: DUF87 domain-containing protein [Patescibacteria group bacterium]|nr:DUF87 domain-containing protein [Patescibacteria group bacterium]